MIIIFIIFLSVFFPLRKACLETCLTGQYCEYFTICKDCNITNCAACKDPSTCTICLEGFYFLNSKCTACPSQCVACNGITECTSCNSGYYLSGGSCFNCPNGCSACSDTGSTCSACLPGYYLNGTSCWNCMFNCASCTDPNSCNTCQQGYTGPHCQCQSPQVWNTTSQQCVQSQNWAVLIAGSSGYEFYRHQADLCHAYQTLINKGFAQDYIIAFSYNDVVYDSQNPYKGKLYNRPCESESDCWDVYAGCNIDYSGSQVTSANILNVLAGNSQAMQNIGSGKVLQSNATDNVFIYYVDDGGTGTLGVPGGGSIMAVDLQSTLSNLYNENKFNQLVFYIEAAKSGSMASNFSPYENIYFLTSANATGTSYGTYCNPNDQVLGIFMNTCLGDMFSVSWLQDTDSEMVNQITLEQQYQEVKRQTINSTVMQYGDLGFTGETIGAFFGQNANGITLETSEKTKGFDVRTIKIETLKNNWIRDPKNLKNKMKYLEESIKNDKATLLFTKLAADANKLSLMQNQESRQITNWECYKDSIELFQEKCTQLTSYSKQYLDLFILLCEDKSNAYPLYYLNEKIKQYQSYC